MEIIEDQEQLEAIGLDGQSYLVGTDDEADVACRDYILDTVWAFNKSFLNGHSKAIAELDEKTFHCLQAQCEGINQVILKMIDDVEHFVDDAIRCDGRGHFLSSYDGDEIELKDGRYAYRLD